MSAQDEMIKAHAALALARRKRARGLATDAEVAEMERLYKEASLNRGDEIVAEDKES